MPIQPSSSIKGRRTAHALVRVSIDASLEDNPSPDRLFGDGLEFSGAVTLPRSSFVLSGCLFNQPTVHRALSDGLTL